MVLEESPEVWEQEVRAIEASAPPGPATWSRAVFTGSSSIRLWATLEADMAPVPVRNHGIGGAQADDVAYYASRLVVAYRPRAVVLYAGENDLESFRGKTPEGVLASVARFHEAIAAFPLLLLSLKPSPARVGDRDAVLRYNALLRSYAARAGCCFVDVAATVVDRSGEADRRCFLDDGLHLSPFGYARWAAALRPALAAAFDGHDIPRQRPARFPAKPRPAS